MALCKPIEDNDAFEWKKCNTNNQCCLSCGRPMEKGEIGFMLKNVHDDSGTKTNLWVHPGCVRSLALLMQSKLENERIQLQKNNSKGIGCLHCGNKVTKGQIHLKLTNANDSIRMRKILWIHKQCRYELALKIKAELCYPQKR